MPVLLYPNQVVIANSEGKRTTPSVVGFVDGGERKVGDPVHHKEERSVMFFILCVVWLLCGCAKELTGRNGF